MIDGITEAAAIEEDLPSDAQLATVDAVFKDGLTLIFDGQTTATKKHYKCNTSVAFQSGDRVKVARISGSYVVEYVVGAPSTGGGGSSASVSELVNGSYKITLDENGNLVPTGNVKLGAENNRFSALYAGALNSKSNHFLSLYDASETVRQYAFYTTINSSNQISALQDVVNALIKIGLWQKLGG